MKKNIKESFSGAILIIDCGNHEVLNREDIYFWGSRFSSVSKARWRMVSDIIIKGENLREIGDNFLQTNCHIKKIVMPSSVEKIGKNFLQFSKDVEIIKA
jgi:hypothetical protein